jgi:hypothetical protein
MDKIAKNADQIIEICGQYVRVSNEIFLHTPPFKFWDRDKSRGDKENLDYVLSVCKQNPDVCKQILRNGDISTSIRKIIQLSLESGETNIKDDNHDI